VEEPTYRCYFFAKRQDITALGMVVSTTSTYDALVNDDAYKFTTCRIAEMGITEMGSYNTRLHEGTVRASLELIL